MNSLAQLEAYSDTEDGEENKLEDESRLPVPEFCLSSKKDSVGQNVDKEGKIRNFPHEPGNWATSVYVPVDSSPEFVKYLNQIIEFLEPLNLKLVDKFHISLSRTVVLKHHWIQDFANTLKNNLNYITCFQIKLYDLEIYLNEQKTRTFLSLKVNEGEENLKEIVDKVDECMKDYNLQTFYKNPSFHLSLFWAPNDKAHEIGEFIHKIPYKLKMFTLPIDVSNCICVSDYYSNISIIILVKKSGLKNDKIIQITKEKYLNLIK